MNRRPSYAQRRAARERSRSRAQLVTVGAILLVCGAACAAALVAMAQPGGINPEAAPDAAAAAVAFITLHALAGLGVGGACLWCARP